MSYLTIFPCFSPQTLLWTFIFPHRIWWQWGTSSSRDEETIYQVRAILDSQQRGPRLEYFINWEDYGPEECSWVARHDILDPKLLTQYHGEHPDCPAPRGRGRPRCQCTIQSSGADHGGGGTVTESQPSQTSYHPSSPDQHAPPSRTLSLEFWFTAPTPHQHSHYKEPPLLQTLVWSRPYELQTPYLIRTICFMSIPLRERQSHHLQLSLPLILVPFRASAQ